MKIILAKQSPPYYENIAIRKSYISIVDGVAKDDLDTMTANQNYFFNEYFPTQEEIETISNNMNIEILTANDRRITLEPKNYPDGIYPNEYYFWNNSNYVKIIHDNGFTEYCYIVKRKCLNLAVNKWTFDLKVDIWNTYWIPFYQAIIKSNMTADVVRWHEDRWVRASWEEEPYVYKFLTTQDTAFWNKETYEGNIKSKISIGNGETWVPWNDELGDTIITDWLKLSNGYGDVFGVNGRQRMFLTPFDRKGFTAIVYGTGNNGSEPWLPSEILKSWYGLPNAFFIAPEFNDNVLQEKDSKTTILDSYKVFEEGFVWDLNNYTLSANTGKIASFSERTIGVIYTPKPIVVLKNMAGNSFKNFSYPNRHKYPANNEADYLTRQVTHLNTENGVTGEVIVTNNYQEKQFFGIEPTINNKNSMLNCLCDERINFDKYTEKFILGKHKLFEEADIDLEPKIYDEELFNVTYSHYNQDQLKISLKWYFFQNYEDLLKWKSIFIEGYQFVSLSYVSLTQYLSRGLYEKYNGENLQNYINISYSPWLSFNRNLQQQFIVNNASQMNTGLNNTAKNLIPALLMTALMGATFASGGAGSMAMTNMMLGATFLKGGIDYSNQKAMQDAKLQDLANSPSQSNDMSSANSFKFLPSENGQFVVNHISDIDKKKIWSYHAETGYYLNKFMQFGTDIKSLATRMYYNFWQINKIKLLAQKLNILNEYKEYFENLFEKGLTLFHENVIIEDKKLYTMVGDYSSENWEISLFNYLEKE